MKLNDLAPHPGATKTKKRVGRGPGGTDKTSGRGHKGYGSRSGSSSANNGSYKSAGGQVPMIRRLPKRGFNHVGQEFHLVNLDDLAVFEGGEAVDGQALVTRRIIKKERYPIKLLGRGDVLVALNVSVDAASASAVAKIQAAGGTITLLGQADETDGGSENAAAGTSSPEVA